MKKLCKTFFSLLFACVLVLSSISIPVKAQATTAASLEDQIISLVQSVFEQANQVSIDDMATQYGKSDFLTALYDQIEETTSRAGKFVKVHDINVDMDEDKGTAEVVLDTEYEKHDATVTININYAAASFSDLFQNVNTDIQYTKAELLEQAGGNTLLGVGIVFCMLILLSFIISLFKQINKVSGESAGNTEKTKAIVNQQDASTKSTQNDSILTQTTDEAGLSDELKIVLATAIAAYEEENNQSNQVNQGGDSYVARPVRRKTTSRWK